MPFCMPRPRTTEFYHHTPDKPVDLAPRWAQGHAYVAGPHEVFIVQRPHAIMVLQPDDFHRDYIGPLVSYETANPDAPRRLVEMES